MAEVKKNEAQSSAAKNRGRGLEIRDFISLSYDTEARGHKVGRRSSPAIYLERLELSKWIKMCGRKMFNSTNSICSAHFWPF
jgi:hypothetical protein